MTNLQPEESWKKKKERKAHKLERNKLVDHVARAVHAVLDKIANGQPITPAKYKNEVRELNTRIKSSVGEAHGVSSWPRPDYEEADFQIAYNVVELYLNQHDATLPTQLYALEGGLQ